MVNINTKAMYEHGMITDSDTVTNPKNVTIS